MPLLAELKFILQPSHLIPYLALIFSLFLLTVSGTTFFYHMFPTKNKMILLGGGSILGSLGWLLILSVFSYIFKGPLSILLYFIAYNSAAFVILFHRSRIKILKEIFKFKFSFQNIPALLFPALFLFLTATAVNSYFGGPDAATYWSIATSYGRGNYPIVSPWQPNYLVGYHTGAFMLLGALFSLTSLGISIVHPIFSIYIAVALMLFVTGLAREHNRSLACFIPGILGIVVFGGPVILTGGADNYIFDLINFSLQDRLTVFPDFKTVMGAAAGNVGNNVWYHLEDVLSINYKTFALAGLMLLTYSTARWHNSFDTKKYIFTILIIFLINSIDETLLLLLAFWGTFIFFYHERKQRTEKILFKAVILGVIAAISFFLLQNPLRDNILNPKNESLGFGILSPEDVEFKTRLKFLTPHFLSGELYRNTSWYMPSLGFIFVMLTAAAYKSGSLNSRYLLLAAVFCMVSAFIAVDKASPSNGQRIVMSSYQLLSFTTGLLFVELYSRVRKKLQVIMLVTLAYLYLPQLINSYNTGMYYVYFSKNSSLTGSFNYKNSTIQWIHDNIPINKRFSFVEGFHESRLVDDYENMGFISSGLIVPMSPPRAKVLNPEAGGEWYDAVTKLSPSSLKTLSVEYIVILHSAQKFLPEVSKRWLSDKSYFQLLYRGEKDAVYKILPAFYQIDDPHVTLKKITDSIPANSTVFLGNPFPYPEIGRGLIFGLNNKVELYGAPVGGGGEIFQHVQEKIKFNAAGSVHDLEKQKRIDYIVAKPGAEFIDNLKDPFEKVMESRDVVMWKNIAASQPIE